MKNKLCESHRYEYIQLGISQELENGASLMFGDYQLQYFSRSGGNFFKNLSTTLLKHNGHYNIGCKVHCKSQKTPIVLPCKRKEKLTILFLFITLFIVFIFFVIKVDNQ